MPLGCLGPGEVAPADRVGRQRAGALQALHLARQLGPEVAQRAVLELGAGAAEQALCLVLEAGPGAGGLQSLQAAFGLAEPEDDRPREQPVEEPGLRGAALGLQALVRAQARLVGTAGAQRS